jgi:hypothetical protein
LGIAALVLEQSNLVLEGPAPPSTVRHHTPIAARRQCLGRHRTVDKVQIRRAGVLLEAERQLEFAGLCLETFE